jgi:hypothetical protein
MPTARSDDRLGWTAVLRLDPSGWHGCADFGRLQPHVAGVYSVTTHAFMCRALQP